MPAFVVRVLGPFEVWRGCEQIPLRPSKSRDLLALLTARSPRPVPADVIIEELWRGDPPPSARKVVQKHVSELRRRLGPVHIVTVASGYALRDVEVDADRFEAAFEQARFEVPQLVAERLRTALDWWAGAPYAGIDLDALAPVRRRLDELHLAAVEVLNEARLALGDHVALVPDVERALVEHPTREALWSQLMRALWAAGRQADALRAYQRVRAVLAGELGIEPCGELRQLEQQILAQDMPAQPSLADVAAHDGLDRREADRRVITCVAAELDHLSEGDVEHRARSERELRERLGLWSDAAGGALTSTLGSRVLISFGAPAHEDDADRAVHLAHQIVTALPSARVAVATGWALVQPDADVGERVVGSVVEVACSALTTTAPGSAHIDRSTTAARARPIDDPPFVGRQRELAIAAGVVERTLAGYGPQAITVRGEPGVGKTRLVAQLRACARGELGWLHACCEPGAPPSAPLAAIVRAHVSGLEGAEPEDWDAAFGRAVERLGVDAAEREWLRVHLRPSGPAAGAEAPGFETVAERSEIVTAWATFLGAVARGQPTVIMLDDVHHTDGAFRSMLADSLHLLSGVPLLMVCTARLDDPEAVFSCVRGDSVTLTLGGLDGSDTDELLGHLLNDDPVTEDQRALIRTRSGGIPLYAIHFARMVRQEGWSGSVPESTRSLIAARLDLLAPLERAMVLAGAVADPRFAAGQLAEMQGVEERAARDAVEGLVEKGLFAARGRDVFAFSHGLVRDVAYDRLLRSRRARLHEAAAVWLERHAADDVAEEAMRIANHLAAAASADEADGRDTVELRERCFRMMITAGQRLEGLGAEDVAVRLAGTADGDHEPGAVADLHGQRAAALARLGRLAEAADAAMLGLESARRAQDCVVEARLAATVGEIQWLRGETSACIGTLDGVMALVADLPRDRATTRALATIAFVTALLGRPAEAIGLAERGLGLARQHGLADSEVRCLNARGAALLLQGDLEGYNDFMRALARALEAGLGHESAMAYHNLAELHLQGLGPASSADLIEEGLVLAEHRGLGLAADWLRASRVQVLFELGRWDDALALADAVLEGEDRSGPGQAGTMCGIWSARIHLWRGDLERARALVETFLPRARQHAVIQQLGPALVVAGLVETASGRVDSGAGRAADFCDLTRDTHEYRHMELADVVRLLVVAGRLDLAVAAVDADVIATIRNECHALTAAATIAAAEGSTEAPARFDAAAERWRVYGHVLEASLAETSAGTRGRRGLTAVRQGGDPRLGLDERVVAALCPAIAGGTGSRPIRNRPARLSST